MKKKLYEEFSSPQKSKLDSKALLINCGFSPNFFYELEQNALILEKDNLKKIKSSNDDIKLLQNIQEKNNLKKIYEAEDKDAFSRKNDENKNNIYLNHNSNKSINNFSSYTTIPSQDCLYKNMCDINIKKDIYAINAYKSKHKKKYIKLYEANSIILEEKNKYKLYHRCCYPCCNRTFSSSGWLKAHLKEHLKQIHNSKYCKLFEKYILSQKIQSMNIKNNKNDFYYKNNLLINSNIDFKNNIQNSNLDNSKKNILLCRRINSPKKCGNKLENDNLIKYENNHLYFQINNNRNSF